MKTHIHFTQRAIHYFSGLTLFLTVSILTNSCKKFDFEDRTTDSNVENEKCGNNNSGSITTLPMIIPCGTVSTGNLIAGQKIDIGSVSIYNTADSLFIDLSTTGNWWIQSANVYVGLLANMPQTPNGNPKVGQFPYQKSLDPKKKVLRFGIPLAGLPSCFIVAVHVEARKVINGQLVQSETAWGQGLSLPGPNWAMGANYCLQTCVSCEYSTIATTLVAEEKQICGQILMTNDSDSLFVTYNMFAGWSLRKIQLYAGAYNSMPIDGSGNPNVNAFPKVRIYNNPISGSVTFGYSLNNLPSNYVVAVHAETERTIGSGTLIESAWGFGDEFIGTSSWGWTVPYTTQICN